jgi:hypothetical protein
VSFAATTLCVASQRLFVVVVYFVINSVRTLLDTPSYVCMYVCMYVSVCTYLICEFFYSWQHFWLLIYVSFHFPRLHSEGLLATTACFTPLSSLLLLVFHVFAFLS